LQSVVEINDSSDESEKVAEFGSTDNDDEYSEEDSSWEREHLNAAAPSEDSDDGNNVGLPDDDDEGHAVRERGLRTVVPMMTTKNAP
jgi:hypothetical protein